MGWSLFGGKKKTEKAARLQAKAAMPPIMAPDETGTPSPQMQPPRTQSPKSGGGTGRPELAAEQIDALTVLAAIESAKQELAERDRAMERSARARAAAGRADPDESPADAVARKKTLIAAAMSVHRIKQKAFSDLSQPERQRLRQMAESALGIADTKKK